MNSTDGNLSSFILYTFNYCLFILINWIFSKAHTCQVWKPQKREISLLDCSKRGRLRANHISRHFLWIVTFLKFLQKYNIVIHFNELVNYYILLLFMLLFIISENKIFNYTLAAALAEANSSLSWYNWLAMLIKFSQLIVSYAKSESSEFPLTKTNFVQQWVWCIHDRFFRKANRYSFHGLAQNIKQLSNYNEQTRSNVNKPS